MSNGRRINDVDKGVPDVLGRQEVYDTETNEKRANKYKRMQRKERQFLYACP